MMSKLTLNKTKTRRCASAALDHPSVEQRVPRSGYTLLDSDVYGLLRSLYSSAPSVSCTGPAPGNTVTRCGAGPTWFGAPLDLFGADLADCSAGGAHGVTRAPARSPSVRTTGVVRHNKTKTKERVHAAVFAPKQTGAPTSILRGGRSAGCWTQVCRCISQSNGTPSRLAPAWRNLSKGCRGRTLVVTLMVTSTVCSDTAKEPGAPPRRQLSGRLVLYETSLLRANRPLLSCLLVLSTRLATKSLRTPPHAWSGLAIYFELVLLTLIDIIRIHTNQKELPLGCCS